MLLLTSPPSSYKLPANQKACRIVLHRETRETDTRKINTTTDKLVTHSHMLMHGHFMCERVHTCFKNKAFSHGVLLLILLLLDD